MALPVILFALLAWWWHTWDLDDPNVVAGVYIARAGGQCTLVELKPNYTFDQQVWKGDLFAIHASGTWGRIGRGGIVFSDQFLDQNGTRLYNNQAYGVIDNTFGFHKFWITSPAEPLIFHQHFLFRTCS